MNLVSEVVIHTTVSARDRDNLTTAIDSNIETCDSVFRDYLVFYFAEQPVEDDVMASLMGESDVNTNIGFLNDVGNVQISSIVNVEN